MADPAELLGEAYKRGILPEDKIPMYEEAVKRGLIKGQAGQDRAAKPKWQQTIEGNTQTFANWAAPGAEEELKKQRRLRSSALATTPTGRLDDPTNRDRIGLEERTARKAANVNLGLVDAINSFRIPVIDDFMEAPALKEFRASNGGKLPSVGRLDVPEATDNIERGADLAGDFAGYAAPGGYISGGFRAAGTAARATPQISSVLMKAAPKGASRTARGTRYAGRMASTVPESAAHAYAFGALTAEPGEMHEQGVEYAKNPLSYLAIPGLSAAERTTKFALTGGRTATPDRIASRVEKSLGVPAGRSPAPGDIADAVPIPNGISDSEARVVARMIGNVATRGSVPLHVVRDTMNRYNLALDVGDQSIANLATFFRRELGDTYPEFVKKLDDSLYEMGQHSPFVSEYLRAMRTSQGDRLSTGLHGASGGKQSITTRERSLTTQRQKIGDEYEPILAAGPQDEAAARELKRMLANPEFSQHLPRDKRSGLRAVRNDRRRTARINRRNGLNFRQDDPYAEAVNENPLQVAHWIYSELRTKAREASGGASPNKTAAREYNQLADMLSGKDDAFGTGPLFKAGGEAYKAANAKFSARSKDLAALDFPDDIFQVAPSSRQVNKRAEAVQQMSDTEFTSSTAAMKEKVRDEVSRLTKENAASTDPINMAMLNRTGAIDAIEKIFNARDGRTGTEIAGWVRRIIDEQALDKAINPTKKIYKRERGENARNAYAGPISAREYAGRMNWDGWVQDAAISFMFGQPLPVRSGMRLAEKLAARAATPSRAQREAFARTLLQGVDGPVRNVRPRQARGTGPGRPPSSDPAGGDPNVPARTGGNAPARRGQQTGQKALPPPAAIQQESSNLPAPQTPAQRYAAEVRARSEAMRKQVEADEVASREAETLSRENAALAKRQAEAERRARLAAREPEVPAYPDPVRIAPETNPGSLPQMTQDIMLRPPERMNNNEWRSILQRELADGIPDERSINERIRQLRETTDEPGNMPMIAPGESRARYEAAARASREATLERNRAAHAQRQQQIRELEMVRDRLKEMEEDGWVEGFSQRALPPPREPLDRAASQRTGRNVTRSEASRMRDPQGEVGALLGVGGAGALGYLALNALQNLNWGQHGSDRDAVPPLEAFQPRQQPTQMTPAEVQQTLNKLGFTDYNGKPLLEDGDLGNRTLAAIRKFRESEGLPSEGEGPEPSQSTLEALAQFR